MGDHREWWTDYPLVDRQSMLVANGVYMLSSFGLEWYMSSRPALLTRSDPKDRQSPFTMFGRGEQLHNVLLGTYSGLSFVVGMYLLATGGRLTSQDALLCHRPTPTGLYAAVCYFFYLSKVWEFVDTFLLILKKKPIIMLHRFHHLTTLPLTWIGIDGNFSYEPCTIMPNLFVHTCMYFYYAFPGPMRFMRQSITTIQIVQFFFVLGVQLYWFYSFNTPNPCDGDWQLGVVGMGVYSMYLVLFLNFYWRQYFYSSKTKAS